jgi:hypothetical protein
MSVNVIQYKYKLAWSYTVHFENYLEDFTMKLRNVIAAATAAVVGAAAMTATAGAYEAFLMYTDTNWGWGNWDAASFPAGNVDVTADGTYTVYVDSSMEAAQVEDEETGELVGSTATGAQVFCVDIDGVAADFGAGKGADGYEDLENTGAAKMAFAEAAGIEISNVVVTTTNSDGTTTDVPVDQSNIIFGDIEGNGKIRIEIYNAYGDTVNAPAVNVEDINFDEKLAVTFTISGIGGEAEASDEEAADDTAAEDTAAETTTTSADKGSPDTGVEGVAAVAGVAALAAGALIVSKKRK